MNDSKSRWLRGLHALCVAFLAFGAVACPADDNVEENLPDFLDTTRPLHLGGLLCVSGAFSAKASTIEQSLVLLEDYINGSSRAYDMPVEEIPCRQQENCGVWVGTDADGNAIRGPLRFLIADTEGDIDATLNAAGILRDDRVPAIIGPCDANAMTDVFNEVTGTETVLMSPVVTADSVTDLVDRSAADIANGDFGYVFRTIIPDYALVRIAGLVALNRPDPQTGVYTLTRAEDETDTECTTESDNFCESTLGSDYHCLLPGSLKVPEREFYTYTETDCGGEPEGFCDELGVNYECIEAPADASERCGSGTCCSRYRERKYCTKTVSPQTALILYEDTDFGRNAKAVVENTWVDLQERTLLAAKSFDPQDFAGFGDVVTGVFAEGEAALPAGESIGDSVVFVFTGTTQVGLIMQQWDLLTDSLPDGSEHVFWVGLDSLRSSLLANFAESETLRNLFVVDPYSLVSPGNELLPELFAHRWQQEPGDYSGTTFDAGLLLAAANERAGRVRERGGSLDILSGSQPIANLGPNTAADLKESLQLVSLGCPSDVPVQRCLPPADPVQARLPADWATAFSDLIAGNETALQGVTGNLALSPEGDRINQVRLWRFASRGEEVGFYQLRQLDPVRLGLSLTK